MNSFFILCSKVSVTQSCKWADPDKDGARIPRVKLSFSQMACCLHSRVSICTCEGGRGLIREHRSLFSRLAGAGTKPVTGLTLSEPESSGRRVTNGVSWAPLSGRRSGPKARMQHNRTVPWIAGLRESKVLLWSLARISYDYASPFSSVSKNRNRCMEWKRPK